LKPADVGVNYLSSADGRAAFERGSVDAWITWDPYVASVECDGGVRALSDGAGLASYQRYYLASRNFAEQQTIADAFYRAGLLPAPVDTKEALYWDFAAEQAKPIGA
jgi:ABC-type nitrate/sulfonate/bicarbonate transport system substrate-binding protein